MTTRGEARDAILAAATRLGERHGREGKESLRATHNVQYITRIAAGRAGIPGNTARAVDPYLVANTYEAAYQAGRMR